MKKGVKFPENPPIYISRKHQWQRNIFKIKVKVLDVASDIFIKEVISGKKGDAVMRIDAYNQIAQVYGTQATNKVSKAQSAYGVQQASDQLTISQTARDFQVAKAAVSGASDVREDKVAELKAMVDSGKYTVNEGDFASKLLAKYNEKITF
ncbi:flagellar biosynthesis anti-sigma factor FlgM [Agathobacter sp.]